MLRRLRVCSTIVKYAWFNWWSDRLHKQMENGPRQTWNRKNMHVSHLGIKHVTSGSNLSRLRSRNTCKITLLNQRSHWEVSILNLLTLSRSGHFLVHSEGKDKCQKILILIGSTKLKKKDHKNENSERKPEKKTKISDSK